MGQQTRQKEIRERRHRREKRRRLLTRELEQKLSKIRSRDERLRVAEEFKEEHA